MLVLGAFVAIQAPQFLSVSNLTQVRVIAAIIAIAAVGEAMSSSPGTSTCRSSRSSGSSRSSSPTSWRRHILPIPVAIAVGIGLGLVLGMVNGVLVACPAASRRSSRRWARCRSTGASTSCCRRRQAGDGDRPARRATRTLARATIVGIPVFVWSSPSSIIAIVGRSCSARRGSGGRSTRSAATRRPRRSWASGRGVVTFAVFSLCGLLAGVAGVLWGMEFGTINATAATGVTLQVIAAVRRRRRQHLRRIRDRRRRRARRAVPRRSSRTR